MSKNARPEAYTAVQRAIGQRIYWARVLVEPNRSEFARLLGVHRTTLQKIEEGERAPSVFNILDIAHRLRVTTDYLLRGSLRGIDGEIAARLVALHPELAPPERPMNIHRRATGSDTSSQPKRPAGRS